MMMEEMGPMILGLPATEFIMYVSGAVYLICAWLVWKPLRSDKDNTLLKALLAFLLYQAVSMIASGIGMHTEAAIWSEIATLSILIGSAYMLKFPFSLFGEKTRKTLFMLTLIVVIVIFAALLIAPNGGMFMMEYTPWYDLVINGVVVCFFIFLAGFRSAENSTRIKAIGGGTGVASCCVVSNGAFLAGAFIVSTVFQFLAPVIIVVSLLAGRRIQNRQAAMPVVTTPQS